MSRWLSRDVLTLPLGKIDEEITVIEQTPMRDRTVIDTERLRDLRDARRRITGSTRGNSTSDLLRDLLDGRGRVGSGRGCG
jgi:hypothetical protein